MQGSWDNEEGLQWERMEVADMILMERLVMNIHHHCLPGIIMTPANAERDEDGPSAIPQIDIR